MLALKYTIAWYRFLPKSKSSDFGQKPWTIVHGFVFGSPKKVVRKVCHSIVNEKRNLMALVSAAQHLPVESYERLKYFTHCTF